ncbi:MAG: rod-binding protein [Candidatus Latescibacterota bacterium]
MPAQVVRAGAAARPGLAPTGSPGGLLCELASRGSSPDPTVREQALRQVAQEFEAILLHQMVAAMRQTVGEGGLLPKGTGERIFEGMLDEEWARKLAGRGGPAGLAEVLYRQLSETQVPRPTGAPSSSSPARFFAHLPAGGAGALPLPGTGSKRP